MTAEPMCHMTRFADCHQVPWRGATAICRACDILRLRAEQKGAGGGGGIIMELRCPASTVMRAAEARVVLDSGADLGQV